MILEWKVENTLKSEHCSHFFIRYLTTFIPQNARSYLMSIFSPSSFPPGYIFV